MNHPLPLRCARTRKRRQLTPFVVDARGLAKLLNAGIRTVRTWDAAGKLPEPIRIGGRVFWLVAEIRIWLRAGAPDRATWAAIRKSRQKENDRRRP